MSFGDVTCKSDHEHAMRLYVMKRPANVCLKCMFSRTCPVSHKWFSREMLIHWPVQSGYISNLGPVRSQSVRDAEKRTLDCNFSKRKYPRIAANVCTDPNTYSVPKRVLECPRRLHSLRECKIRIYQFWSRADKYIRYKQIELQTLAMMYPGFRL